MGSLIEVKLAATISLWAVICGVAVILWCLLFLGFAVMINPGMELTHQDPLVNIGNAAYCSVCEVVRKEGTVHCLDCEVCVKGQDHHCPWTGKCIGEGNLPYFYAFLMGVVAAVLFIVTCAMFSTSPTKVN